MVTESIIPEEWKEASIESLSKTFTKQTGFDYSAYIKPKLISVFKEGTLPFIQNKDFHAQDTNFDTDYFIPEKVANNFPRILLDERCLLISISGKIGNVGVFSNLRKSFIGGAVAVVKFKDKKQLDWVMYYLLSPEGQHKLLGQVKAGSHQNLILADIREIKIPMPSENEQKLIVNSLSDIDKILKKLDKLLTKKKNIKKGAMQELLTGKKRLLGFSGEWEEKELGSISDIKTGGKNNEDKIKDGKYPFFVRSQTVERINSYSFDGEAILVPGEGGVGSIFHYINGKFEVHQRVYKISDFSKNLSGKFIYYYMLQHFNKQAMKNSVKATVDSLRLPTFQEFKLMIPNDKKEQLAITEVLDDLNSEIQELERKRDKYKMIKEGMMQQLLTGRIRLKC